MPPMRPLTLSLLILGAWLLVVTFETGILFPGYGFSHEDLMGILLFISPALVVGLVVGCFVTRVRPFRPALPIVAIVASVIVTSLLVVALSVRNGSTFKQSMGWGLMYLPVVCIFSIPAAVTCLWSQACRRYWIRKQQ